MKNRGDHDFEIPAKKHCVPKQVLKNWPEGDGVKVRTAIFVDVNVTPDERKVSTDDRSLNGMPLSVAYSQCIPVFSLWEKKTLDSTYKTVDSSNVLGSSWKNGTTLRCKMKGCEAGIVITPVFSANPGPNSKAKNHSRKLLTKSLVLVTKVNSEHWTS
jgi:hypothetical protein